MPRSRTTRSRRTTRKRKHAADNMADAKVTRQDGEKYIVFTTERGNQTWNRSRHQ